MESMETAAWRMSQYRKSEEQLWKYFCGICWNKIKGDKQ